MTMITERRGLTIHAQDVINPCVFGIGIGMKNPTSYIIKCLPSASLRRNRLRRFGHSSTLYESLLRSTEIRMRTFGRGDQVVWRSLPEGNVGYVFPATIVCDDDDVIGLFQHTGSICKKRTGKRAGPGGRNMLPGGWDGGYSDREWTGRSNLHLHKMGSGHTVIRSWDPDQQRICSRGH